MPELVATLCTFLVLSPLALMPGLGQFLFKPMAMAVAFAMIAAYFLSRTLVPACSALWLKPHASHDYGRRRSCPRLGRGSCEKPRGGRDIPDQWQWPQAQGNIIARAFHRWERMIDTGIAYYVKGLDVVLRHRISTVAVAYQPAGADHRLSLAGAAQGVLPRGRRGLLRDVRPGALAALRIEETEKRIAAVEEFVRKVDRQGRPATGALRAGRHVRLVGRLHAQRRPDGCRRQGPAHGASGRNRPRNTCAELRAGCRRQVPSSATWSSPSTPAAWSARRMNEGKSTPINIRVTGKDQKIAHRIARAIRSEVIQDRRRGRRPDHPAARLSASIVINVDRAKAASSG